MIYSSLSSSSTIIFNIRSNQNRSLAQPRREVIESTPNRLPNLDHNEGKHKARVFKAALNMDVSHLEKLKQALRSAVETYDTVPAARNAYGQKYVIDFPLTHEDKTAIIHSVLIVKDNENFSRLITRYVL